MSDNDERNVGSAEAAADDDGELSRRADNMLRIRNPQQPHTSDISQRVQSAVKEFKEVLQLILTDSQRVAAAEDPENPSGDNAILKLQEETMKRAAKQVLINLQQKDVRRNNDDNRDGFTKCSTEMSRMCVFCRKNKADGGVKEVPVDYTKGLEVLVPDATCSSNKYLVYFIRCLEPGCNETYVGKSDKGMKRVKEELSEVPFPEESTFSKRKKSFPDDTTDAMKKHLRQHLKAYWDQRLYTEYDWVGMEDNERREKLERLEELKKHQFVWIAPLQVTFDKVKQCQELDLKAAECFWIAMLEPEVNRGV